MDQYQQQIIDLMQQALDMLDHNELEPKEVAARCQAGLTLLRTPALTAEQILKLHSILSGTAS